MGMCPCIALFTVHLFFPTAPRCLQTWASSPGPGTNTLASARPLLRVPSPIPLRLADAGRPRSSVAAPADPRPRTAPSASPRRTLPFHTRTRRCWFCGVRSDP
eukprot:scaffold1105_cov310-Pavlova_lutheri.AAC.2